jgi:pimeloyl-ACP methyl ester carboxylesterase
MANGLALRRAMSGLTLAIVAMASTPGLAEGIAEKRITVAPGMELRTIEAGEGQGRPPIVFIPGWSTGADIWRDQLLRFSKDRRVIAIDPRSQGESTKSMSGNTPEQRAVDLHVLLEKQGVKRPVLVGWSQAVQDIAAYVERYGTQDIAGIVLIDAAVADGAKAIAERPQQAASLFRRLAIYHSDQQAYVRGFVQAIIGKPQAAGVVDHAIEVAMKTPASIGVSMLVADLFGADRTPALAKMDCPVMIIAAATSSELEQQKAEAKVLKNGKYVEIGDSAHAVFLDQPDRFSTALAEFINTVE